MTTAHKKFVSLKKNKSRLHRRIVFKLFPHYFYFNKFNFLCQCNWRIHFFPYPYIPEHSFFFNCPASLPVPGFVIEMMDEVIIEEDVQTDTENQPTKGKPTIVYR